MPPGKQEIDNSTVPGYAFKPSPYSSHSVLLQLVQAGRRAARILDVGCASGYMAEILVSKGHEVVGIDKPGAISNGFPAAATFIPADLDSGLPPLPGKFDYILCADVLEHLREPLKLLRELLPYLTPEGRLLASLPNSGNLYFRLNVLLGRFPHHDRGLFDRTHLHFYTWAGWVELFSRSGLSIESAHPTSVPVGLAFPRWDNSLPIRWLERLAYSLARAWMKLFVYQFVVVARPEASS